MSHIFKALILILMTGVAGYTQPLEITSRLTDVRAMVGEGDTLCKAVAELIEIGRRAKVPVHVAHFKVCGKPNWGQLSKAVELVENARDEGQVVTADQYPYVATSTSLFSILMPVAKIPGGWSNLSKRMEADETLAKHVRQVIRQSLDRSNRVVIASCANKLDERPSRTTRTTNVTFLDIQQASKID